MLGIRRLSARDLPLTSPRPLAATPGDGAHQPISHHYDTAVLLKDIFLSKTTLADVSACTLLVRGIRTPSDAEQANQEYPWMIWIFRVGRIGHRDRRTRMPPVLRRLDSELREQKRK